MMEEFRSRSILDCMRAEEKSDLCRFIFIGRTTLSSEEVIKFISERAKEHFAERVTGLTLVYPNFMINLVESTENDIFQVCSYMIDAQPGLLKLTTYFPMETNVEERFFEKWYSNKVVDFQDKQGSLMDNLGQSDVDDFDKIARICGNVIENLYIFFHALREARMASRARLMEKLNELGSVGNCHLPEEKTLCDLLENSWGRSLESLLYSYYNEIHPRDIDDEIWPFPEYQCSPIDTENI